MQNGMRSHHYYSVPLSKAVDFSELRSWCVTLCLCIRVPTYRNNVLPSSYTVKGSQRNAKRARHSSWTPQPLKVKAFCSFETLGNTNQGHSITYQKNNTAVGTRNLSWSAKVCPRQCLEQHIRHQDSHRSWPTSSFESQPSDN